ISDVFWCCAPSVTTIVKRRASPQLKVSKRWFPAITRLICRLWRRPRSSETRWYETSWRTGRHASPPFLTYDSKGESLRGPPRQGSQTLGEYERSSHDIFRGCVLVGTVAVSVAAGDEQHRNRGDARDEKRVMISATDHRDGVQSVLTAGLRKCFDYGGSAVRGRVGVQQLAVDRDLPFG